MLIEREIWTQQINKQDKNRKLKTALGFFSIRHTQRHNPSMLREKWDETINARDLLENKIQYA